MLKPSEIIAGHLADAPPRSMMPPVGDYGLPFLIGTNKDALYAVCLSGSYRWLGFKVDAGANYSGIIVPDIAVEVDETSLFDASYGSNTSGAMIRQETGLFIASRGENPYGASGGMVGLIDSLPESKRAVGFKKWCVTIGAGVEKRVLFEVDLSQPDP